MSDRHDPEAAAIESVMNGYFLGMYAGDADRLRQIFNPRCWLFGEYSGECHEFPLADILEQIGSGPAPKSECEPYDMRLVALNRTESVAVAKVEDATKAGATPTI